MGGLVNGVVSQQGGLAFIREVIVRLCLRVVYLSSGRSVVVASLQSGLSLIGEVCHYGVVSQQGGLSLIRMVLMGFHCTSVAEGNDNETDGHRKDGIGSDFDSTAR